MALLIFSPIALFAALALIDVLLSVYEYKIKLKQWVLPKLWLISNNICTVGYASLILMSNMYIGIISASLCIITLMCIKLYLHYIEHSEMQKIISLKEGE
jgi:hypothetical protein